MMFVATALEKGKTNEKCVAVTHVIQADSL
jgi:hypothetical protein